MQRRKLILGGLAGGFALSTSTSRLLFAQSTPAVIEIPSADQLTHVFETLKSLGEPLPDALATRALALATEAGAPETAADLERVLSPYTLLRIQLSSHGAGRCELGGAPPELNELGWRSFLVRVENPARLKGPLKLIGRFAIAEGSLMPGIHEPQTFGNDRPELVHEATQTDWNWDLEPGQWLGFRFGAPTLPGLVGESVEYQILQLYSQRGGSNSTTLVVGADTLRGAALADSKGVTVNFDAQPARTVSIRVLDVDGQGTTCSLLITDPAARLYPAPGHRIEPDIAYQPHIYRADGESIRVPPGRYSVMIARGPEYLRQTRDLTVGDHDALFEIKLQRWIDPARHGWYSGDPHIHPEGTAYAIVSKDGMTPETMIRQIRGEGLNAGSVLIWTSGYYYQKQFLTGRIYESTAVQPFAELQRANNSALALKRTPHDSDTVMEHGVEQAAFPSNLMGHLILLRLERHDWPGGASLFDWPTWNLPILKWAKEQSAVTGYAHPGADPIALTARELPNYEVPRLFGIGANEAVVDVTHGLVDFLAGGESVPEADLNLWYHLLNCGLRLPMVGETDSLDGACRPGQIRTYVQLDQPPVGDSGYAAWVDGLKNGHVYFGDGRSHLFEFHALGRNADSAQLDLHKAGPITLTAKVAARLEPEAFNVDEENKQLNTLRYWHIERARIGTSRKVPLEVVVNGHAVQRHEIVADGELRNMRFTLEVSHSSWIALRILPSAHSAPVFVQVAGRPIRASRRSAQWCLDCIDVLWERHVHRLREAERAPAAAAFEHARQFYRAVLAQSGID